ncbi:hypothetical protein EC973_003669 [Apophysomyces ossiformis]|uniref:BRCT domain-containing protein n=1 Tax=Apophysomyces ossiformis TaxID=679940 RepID=A0A8H7BLJ0_9FUNG|nr:hypothetical protein EC973_003669 [Apophysomyces ossiformis]
MHPKPNVVSTIDSDVTFVTSLEILQANAMGGTSWQEELPSNTSSHGISISLSSNVRNENKTEADAAREPEQEGTQCSDEMSEQLPPPHVGRSLLSGMHRVEVQPYSSLSKPGPTLEHRCVIVRPNSDNVRLRTNLEKMAAFSFVKIVDRLSHDATHVVVFVDEQNRTKMTTKYLLALLSGKYIVSEHWVYACCSQGSLVPEEPYEVTGDFSQDASRRIPRMARLSLKAQQPRLFSGLSVCFFGPLEGGRKTRDDLEQMIRIGGGRVIDWEDMVFPFHGEIICSSKTGPAEIGQIQQMYGKQPVLASWIIQSISVYRLLDKHQFLCCGG